MMGNRDRFLREADSGGGWHPVAPVHSLFRQYIYFVDFSSLSSSSSYKYIQRSCDDQNSSFMPMMLLQICTSVWNEASSVWNRNDRWCGGLKLRRATINTVSLHVSTNSELTRRVVRENECACTVQLARTIIAKSPTRPPARPPTLNAPSTHINYNIRFEVTCTVVEYHYARRIAQRVYNNHGFVFI